MSTVSPRGRRAAPEACLLTAPSQPRKLGRHRASPVPVELAVEGADRKLRTRFPAPLWFVGELVQVRAGRGGRQFAVLRGGDARIDVHVPPQVSGRGPSLEAGMKVLVRGTLRIRRQSGGFRIEACSALFPTDTRGLRAEMRRVAQRELTAEGVFSRSKRPLPEWPSEVAVVSSPRGAAIQDIRAVIHRRAPWVRVRLHPCGVQGPGARDSVVRAMEAANRSTASLVIVGRGGGAADDLEVFDDPAVVRSIAASRLPVIAAVGHETDHTLADRAADLRAPTPSAAAERAVPDRSELHGNLRALALRLDTALLHQIVAARTDLIRSGDRVGQAVWRRVELARERLDRLAPVRLGVALRRTIALDAARVARGRTDLGTNLKRHVDRHRRRLDDLTPARLRDLLEARLRVERERVARTVRMIEALSPPAVLARGYALIARAEGGPVRSIEELEAGGQLRLVLGDGEVAVVVERVSKRPIQGEDR